MSLLYHSTAHLFVHLFICLFVCLFIYLFIYLFICSFVSFLVSLFYFFLFFSISLSLYYTLVITSSGNRKAICPLTFLKSHLAPKNFSTIFLQRNFFILNDFIDLKYFFKKNIWSKQWREMIQNLSIFDIIPNRFWFSI